ncbi:MAG: cytochrome c maturation protein CcmE [Chloroflexi bacterium]|nr:cytochrome c maturation protein CcmE [Chloroflexota bacterium]
MKKVILIAGIAVIVLGGLLVMAMFGGFGGMEEHLTTSQALGDVSGRTITVGGEVQPRSVVWDNATQSISFTLADEGASIKVSYRGRVPNDFKPGASIVADGRFNRSGTFEASSLRPMYSTSPLCKACHG